MDVRQLDGACRYFRRKWQQLYARASEGKLKPCTRGQRKPQTASMMRQRQLRTGNWRNADA